MSTFDFTPLDDENGVAPYLRQRAGESAPAVESAPGQTVMLRDLRPGMIVEGVVLSVSRDEVVLDLNHKTEGIIPRAELPPHFNVKVGQPLKAMVVDADGDEGVSLSYSSALQVLGWAEIEAAVAANRSLRCVVTACVKASGFRVKINGVTGFMPFSQAGMPGLQDGEELVGRELDCRVIRIDRERHDVVVSHRKHKDEERAGALKTIFAKVRVGDVVHGTVKAIRRDFVFVDLGGVDAFLHASNLAWRYIREPGDVVTVGQELDVRVLEIDETRQRIAVGLKQLQENPWLTVPARFPVGATVGGRVTGLSKFGAFVELAEGVTGLVPLREISWNPRLRHPAEEVAEGDRVNVRVEAINTDEQRLTLSLKGAQPDPWLDYAARNPEGGAVTGTVRAVAGRTLFVTLAPGVDGIIRHDDLSWDDAAVPPAVGDSVTAKVLAYDRQEHLVRLGLKQLADDPWLKIAARYPVGTSVEGTVTRVAAFGAFLELEPGVDGLVHISQLAAQPVDKVETVAKVGQQLQAKVIKVDLAARRLGLSVRDRLKDQERQDLQQYLSGRRGGGVSLGDMLGTDWQKTLTSGGTRDGN